MSNAFPSVRGFARALAVSVLTMAVVLSSASVSFAAGVTASVKTGDTGNGKIDFISVRFNVPMDRALTPKVAASAGQPGFFVEGYSVTGFEWAEAAPAPAQTLKVKVAEGNALDGTAEPVVHYGSGGDAVSALGIEADAFRETAADGAGPILLSFLVHDAAPAGLFNAKPNGGLKGDEALLVFSEPAKLAGETRFDRWSNLEKAIKFNNAGGGCPSDGQGLNTVFNFPQPGAATTSIDPIVAPLNSTEATTSFRVRHQTDATNSQPQAFVGVPTQCWVGVEPGTVNTGNLIVGADGNPAIGQVAGPGVAQPMPTPVEAQVLSAETKDGVGGPADGALDAVELTFEQAIDIDTVRNADGQPLNVPTISVGSFTATVDASQIRHRKNASNQDITNTLILPFTLPAGIEWDTGVRPSVRYTKPFACSADTTANGIKAKVPSGGTWRACVASFDISEAHDRAAPLALSAVTTDGDGNGRIESVTVNFAEPIKQGTANGWTLNGQPATGFSLAAGGRTATIPVTEGPAGDTGSTAKVAYASVTNAGQQTKDFWDNQLVAASLDAADGAGPRIQTASVHDLDGNGRLDHAVLTYSEPIVDPAAGAASAFKVGGVQATGFAPGTGDDPNGETLTLVIDVAGTGVKTVEFNGTQIKDAANNLAGGQIVDAADVIDQAPAVATISVEPGAPLGVGVSTVTVGYSEPMDTGTAPAVALGGTTVNPLDDGEHNNGFLDADASVWEGTVTVAENACGTPTGCAVQLTASGGVDLGGIAPRAASLATEIDTIAPQPPTLGTFDADHAPGQSAPANTVNMFTQTVALSAGIVPGDAAGGHAEILMDGNVLPGSQSAPIAAGAGIASGSRTFVDLDALRTALPEGAHQLSVNLCDDAGNCTETADSIEVLMDSVSVDIQLVEPAGGDIVGGGESRTISWNGDETSVDLDHVEVHLSTNNGSTYGTLIDGTQAADGSLVWTVPALDVAAARIRALTVDTAGNKASQASNAFAIDSTAPVLTLDAPSSDPFLPAGGTSMIRWTATDATIEQATAPITIEYSLNGTTWLPINGGAYSKADDGVEAFNVPNVDTFSLKARVRATDATGKSTTVTSSPLAAGVAGYVVDAKGTVVRFGSADARTNETRLKRGDEVTGIALAPGARTGYVLGTSGTLYPFSIGSANKPRARAVKLSAPDSARAVILTGTSKGYVVGMTGQIFAFGGAPVAKPSKTMLCACARAIVLAGNGGYVMTSRGDLLPFRIGTGKAPARLVKRDLFRRTIARDVVLNGDGRSGYVLTSSGRLVGFGRAARVRPVGARAGADAQALVRITDTGGYWLDAKGMLHRYGSAIGDPTRTAPFTSARARGAAS